jgi:preprotein translocase subunit SecG
MEIDRASAQRIMAKLGFTLGFLFLLAIIALAFA